MSLSIIYLSVDLAHFTHRQTGRRISVPVGEPWGTSDAACTAALLQAAALHARVTALPTSLNDLTFVEAGSGHIFTLDGKAIALDTIEDDGDAVVLRLEGPWCDASEAERLKAELRAELSEVFPHRRVVVLEPTPLEAAA